MLGTCMHLFLASTHNLLADKALLACSAPSAKQTTLTFRCAVCTRAVLQSSGSLVKANSLM